MMKYYYEITDRCGEKMYVEVSVKPKSPEKLCEFLMIDGTAREITKAEYDEAE